MRANVHVRICINSSCHIKLCVLSTFSNVILDGMEKRTETVNSTQPIHNCLTHLSRIHLYHSRCNNHFQSSWDSSHIHRTLSSSCTQCTLSTSHTQCTYLIQQQYPMYVPCPAAIPNVPHPEAVPTVQCTSSSSHTQHNSLAQHNQVPTNQKIQREQTRLFPFPRLTVWSWHCYWKVQYKQYHSVSKVSHTCLQVKRDFEEVPRGELEKLKQKLFTLCTCCISSVLGQPTLVWDCMGMQVPQMQLGSSARDYDMLSNRMCTKLIGWCIYTEPLFYNYVQ